MTTQWKRAHAFAEYAETLQTDTRNIMAVSAREGVFMVFYTPDLGMPERIWSAKLWRDSDGILRVVGGPIEEIGLWEQLKDSLR